MQINVALSKNNKEQAEKLRKAYYPNTTANETRDAFIFNRCIDCFADELKELRVYLEKDDQAETVQRMLTIKAESNERLKTIAESLNVSIAATFRSIIAYNVDKIDGSKTEKSTVDETSSILLQQLLKEKVALLETRLADCINAMSEIKELLNNH